MIKIEGKKHKAPANGNISKIHGKDERNQNPPDNLVES